MSKLLERSRSILKRGLVLGLAVSLAGILLASTDLGHSLEEEVGLNWLFKLRGPLPPPDEVVIISIDHTSSKKLGLPNKPRKWPRSLHGDLVSKLSRLGATVIVFDIIFEEDRNIEEDILFSKAISEAGNVILFQSLKKEPIEEITPEGQVKQIGYIETLGLPVPVLSESAIALAPFPLPKIPIQINHFLTFKPELGNYPTLPVAALQFYSLSAYEILYDLLSDVTSGQITQLPGSAEQIYQSGDIQNLVQEIRQLFLDNKGLELQFIKRLDQISHTLKSNQYQLLKALIHTYAQPHSLYLNFYGPPQTINTVPYFEIIDSEDHDVGIDFSNKAVFIGFSEGFQPEQKDGFYTVFSQENSGLDISGVEIIATSFANLLHDESLKINSAVFDILTYIIWAIILSMMLRSLPTPALLFTMLVLGFAYHQLVFELFRQENIWMPIAIPLLWQAPLAFTGALLWNYIDIQRERRNIRHAFGKHLPIEVVDKLAKGVEQIATTAQQAYGIVMATDAQQYTGLSEKMTPVELRDYMNRYYDALFRPIRESGGVISDVIGDAVLALWVSSLSDPVQRKQACDAALDVLNCVEAFNQQNPGHHLPTRLGLHAGDLMLGHVGAMDHYEYRAVGDIVNTASRIESLNKQLGTRILVSEEMLKDVDGIIVRELGEFLLMGKSKPLALYELVTNNKQNVMDEYDGYISALELFREQQWRAAAKGFERLSYKFTEDGPSRYFLKLCREYIDDPPKQWDGVIRIRVK